MGLSNYELVLLDSLVCLWSVPSYFKDTKNERTIGAMVDKFLTNDSGIDNGLCYMDTGEWREVLNAIKYNQKLRDLKRGCKKSCVYEI